MLFKPDFSIMTDLINGYITALFGDIVIVLSVFYQLICLNMINQSLKSSLLLFYIIAICLEDPI